MGTGKQILPQPHMGMCTCIYLKYPGNESKETRGGARPRGTVRQNVKLLGI